MHVLASSGHPALASNLLFFAGDGLPNMTALPPVSCEHKLIQLRVLTVLGSIHSCLLQAEDLVFILIHPRAC